MIARRVSLGQSLVAVLAVLAILAFSRTAAAQERAAEEWSFGAGLGNLFTTFVPVQSGGNVVLVPTGGSGVPLSFSLERKFTPNLWLGLRTDLSLSSTRSKPSGSSTESTDSANSYAAALELRYVLSPGAIVEFSPLFGIGVTGTSSSTKSGSTTVDSASSVGPTAGVGFSVESYLGRGVALRLSTLVLSFSYLANNTEHRTSATSTLKSTGSTTRFGLSLSPELEVRLYL